MKKKSYNIARRINNNFASSAEIKKSSDPYNQRIHSKDFDLIPAKEWHPYNNALFLPPLNKHSRDNLKTHGDLVTVTESKILPTKKNIKI